MDHSTKKEASVIQPMPPINHFAWVVEDLDEAIDFWVRTMRVGPFFVIAHVQYAELEVEGRPASVDISIALAWRGDAQIELIQQHDDSPSVFNICPATGGGVQHIGVRTTNAAALEQQLVKAGMRRVQRGVNSMGAETIYLHGGPSAGVIELIEVKDGNAFLERMKKAAAEWDGVTPRAN